MAKVDDNGASGRDHVTFSKNVLISEKRGISRARNPDTGRLLTQGDGQRAVRPSVMRRLFGTKQP